MSRRTLIGNIVVLKTEGSWKSKSGGELKVILAFPRAALKKFLDVDNPAFNDMPEDMRGLRLYTVSSIPKGGIGGNEWHKARTECISALSGAAVLHCVDIEGNKEDFTLDGCTSVVVPPGILHTYEALEDDTVLQVLANTLFVPEDPRTHDTFPADTFEYAAH